MVVQEAAPVIQVQDLQKRYRDGTYAVRGITFEVRRGEIFGLLGPNGAGKTTTMRILGTLHRPTGGQARVLGLDPTRHPGRLRRRMGFAMQEVGMDDLATAWEMLMFHARLYKVPRAEAADRAERLLRTFGLWDHRARRVTRFSGGMQRRLDLAVSIIHEPEVLFLDEPSTGLDPQSRSELWRILQRLRDEKGLTILMSTHYMQEADALCDRIAIMSAGRIAAVGTPSDLKRSVGSDRLRVRLDRVPREKEVTALRGVFGGHNVSLAGDRMDVLVKDGEVALVPALEEIAALGLRPRSTRVLSPSLDDAYLSYTGSRIAEEEVDASAVDPRVAVHRSDDAMGGALERGARR